MIRKVMTRKGNVIIKGKIENCALGVPFKGSLLIENLMRDEKLTIITFISAL